MSGEDDALGNVTKYEYDGFDAVKKTTYEDGTTVVPAYDSARLLTSVTVRDGQSISYTYDEHYRVISKILPDNTVNTKYDIAGRVYEVNDVTGTYSYTYDSAGRLIQVDSPDSRTVKYEYDLNGNRTKITYPDSSYVTYHYDTLNRLTDVNDSSGTSIASYDYDDYGRRQKVTYANGNDIQYTYDVHQRLATIDNDTNDVDHIYQYTYDDVGNRSTMKVNGSDMHSYTYDKIYQITKGDYPSGYFVNDTDFAYDAMGNRTDVNDPNNSAYAVNALNQYTQAGGVWFDHDDMGNLAYDGTYHYEYDTENRLTKVTKSQFGGTDQITVAVDSDLPFTTGGDAEWFIAYDPNYYVKDKDSARSGAIGHNESTWLKLQANGRGTIKFSYKASSASGDNLTFKIDGTEKFSASGTAGGTDVSYEVDSIGTHTFLWTYSKNGSGTANNDCAYVDKVSWTPASTYTNKVALQQALDVGWNVYTGGTSGNLWTKDTTTTYNDSDSAEASGVGDDENARMEAIVEVEGTSETISFYWKVSSEENSDELEFYIDGVLKDSISGEVDWTQKQYTVTGAGEHSLMWQYIKDSSVSSGSDTAWVDYLTGPGTAPPQPDDNAPISESLDTALTVTLSGDEDWTTWTSESYYDGDAVRSGPITHSQESIFQSSVNVASSETLTFWWKVSSEANGDYLKFYIDGSPQDSISGEVEWEKKEYTLSSGNHTLKWAYEKDGSVSSGDDYGYVDFVQYSALDTPPTLTSWKNTVTYTYDPSGRRISKATDGLVLEKYVYAGDQVIATYDGEGNLLRKFIYGVGIDEAVCMIDVEDSNAKYYYHYDGLGSVVALSDSSGDSNSVQIYDYSVYGVTAVTNPDYTNPYMFTGRRLDPETGFYYYRARYYAPNLGRFLQTDPIGYKDGLNWYRYCGNNPTNRVDPSGMDAYLIFRVRGAQQTSLGPKYPIDHVWIAVKGEDGGFVVGEWNMGTGIQTDSETYKDINDISELLKQPEFNPSDGPSGGPLAFGFEEREVGILVKEEISVGFGDISIQWKYQTTTSDRLIEDFIKKEEFGLSNLTQFGFGCCTSFATDALAVGGYTVGNYTTNDPYVLFQRLMFLTDPDASPLGKLLQPVGIYRVQVGPGSREYLPPYMVPGYLEEVSSE